jgi:hypothetical protein
MIYTPSTKKRYRIYGEPVAQRVTHGQRAGQYMSEVNRGASNASKSSMENGKKKQRE